jgi:hypothetical protein
VEINDGTFYGRRGANWVGTNVELFYGGPDRDIVDVNLAYGADVLDGPRSGTFYGRGGDDHVKRNSRAFHGGRGATVWPATPATASSAAVRAGIRWTSTGASSGAARATTTWSSTARAARSTE